MKSWSVLLIAVIALAGGWLAHYIPLSRYQKAGPITEAAHRVFDRHFATIISAAESMPTNKYAYAPADSDDYFIEIVNQATSAALHRCGQMINLSVFFEAPPLPKEERRRTSPEAPAAFKDAAVKQLRTVRDLCDREFGLVNDSQLDEVINARGGQKTTKAEAMMDLIGEVAEADRIMGMYLQMNGVASPAPQ
jgi:hypothetical protein